MIYSGTLKQGGTPIAFEQDNISREYKGNESRIVISNPVNTSEHDNRDVPQKIYLHEIELKPEHRAEIVNRFRPKKQKKQNAVRPRI